MSALLKFGQRFAGVIQPTKNLMSFLFSGQRTVTFCLLLAAMTTVARGQTNYAAQGTEYAVIGSFLGDQVFPSVSINSAGGYLVWQDNITDGDGWGISAQRLGGTLSAINSTFRVNSNGAGNQEQPKVSLLKNGGAVVVWQGGAESYQHIYARFFTASNTFLTGDVLVNGSPTNVYQVNPVVAVLTNNTAVIAYGSYNQVSKSSMQDVYFQRMNTNGAKVGAEVLVNQFTTYNQRTPAIAALATGKFVVVWVSEQERSVGSTNGTPASVDIYGRIYNADGTSVGSEFLINSNFNVCANPSVVGAADGSFAVAWSEMNMLVPTNSWDISVRTFSSAGVGGAVKRVNTYTYGEQYAPVIAADGAAGAGYMIAWTSLGQDGSREGVFSRFMNVNGTFSGGEVPVNSTTSAQQMHPAVASDANGRFLAVWTSFEGVPAGFDLYAQRFSSTIQPLSAPNPPYVTVISSNTLTVSWQSVGGFTVASYGVYVDGSPTPTVNLATNAWGTNVWSLTGLAPSSTHYFKLDYLLTDGRRSPQSGATTNTTYGTLMWGGIPYEWMTAYFGSDVFNWPSPTADSDGDGVSNLQEFQAGTNPTNALSVLRQQMISTGQGPFLQWNTEPGLMYQVIQSVDMKTWSNFSGPRFAAGHVDSIPVGGSQSGYFRIIRLR